MPEKKRPGKKRGGTIRIGISGWTYAPWRGVFYPKKLAHRRELGYAAGQFRSIEINGTFYGLQRPETFIRWRDETPEDFVFAIKASRYITHMRRLRNIEEPLANFLVSGLLELGPKLGPILWQFPPRMKFDAALFGAFLDLLPKDTKAAQGLIRRHASRRPRGAQPAGKHHRLRHAVEIRDESFRDPAFIRLLRRHKIALVCADTVDWPRLMDLTADFVYCRLHGSEKIYESGYDKKSLDDWASRLRSWQRGGEPQKAERVLPRSQPRQSGRDVFVYFDNDKKVRAPADAASLAGRVY